MSGKTKGKGLTTLAVALVVGYGLVQLGFSLASRDIPPPDESFFEVERPEVAPGDNAYLHFLEATNNLVVPKILEESICRSQLDDLDTHELRDIVESNAACLHRVRQGTDCTVFQPPPIGSFMEDTPNVGPWLTVAKVLRCEMELARAEGRYVDAVSSTLLELRMGDMIQAGAETLIHYLVGAAIVNFSLEQIQLLAQDENTSAKELAALDEALDRLGSRGVGLERALKGEYRQITRTIDELPMRGKQPKWIQELSDRNLLKKFFQRRSAGSRYFYQPNRSKKLFADHFQEQMKNTPLVYADMTFPPEEDLDLTPWDYVRRNAISRMLVAMLMPALDRTFSSLCRSRSEVEGTRLVLACNRFEREKGHWPETLQELVPEFLDAVPTDPFDGNPFRYSAEKGIVYSVGQNLTDEGGTMRPAESGEEVSTRRNWRKAEDLVYEIRPAVKPVE